MKKALCIGINNYQRSPLSGCINDCIAWQNRLLDLGFEVKVLIDKEATRDSVLKEITNLMDADEIAFTFSGHGTQIPDLDGDEQDKLDEAIVCYDYIILDDEIKDLLSRMKTPVSLIFDCCHSGSITRNLTYHVDLFDKPRFLKPTQEDIRIAKLTKKTLPRALNITNYVKYSGCEDNQYSYDAWIAGKPQGAFTYHLNKILDKDIKIKDLEREIKKVLPSNKYPQSPVLTFCDNFKDKKMFELSDATIAKKNPAILFVGKILFSTIISRWFSSILDKLKKNDTKTNKN